MNNPIVQKNLDAIVNKKLGELFIEAEYIAELGSKLMFFRYGVALTRETSGKYVISYEELSSKKATSKNDSMETIFKVVNGEIISIKGSKNDELLNMALKKTINLLSTTSMCALFYEKSFTDVINNKKKPLNNFFVSLIVLLVLGLKLHVYLDESDDHRDYFIHNSFGYLEYLENNNSNIDKLLEHFLEMDSDLINIISVSRNLFGRGG
ncbi:hypothetical protein ABXS75_18740 [Roseburia hominis]